MNIQSGCQISSLTDKMAQIEDEPHKRGEKGEISASTCSLSCRLDRAV